MTNKKEVLEKSTINGNILKLPATTLSRELYLEVKKALELIGGKWTSGKTQGFVFKEDPTDLVDGIINGNGRNLKKEYQFFATPDKLADKLVFIANPSVSDKILEPSAGQGAIVKAINRAIGDVTVDCFELMPVNQQFLRRIKTVNLLGDDFTKANLKNKYDVIIANPPFAKNQDIDHVYLMYEALKEGGKMVVIISNHYKQTDNKKEVGFRNWIKERDAQLFDVPAGEFKESGTTIATTIIKVVKSISSITQINLSKHMTIKQKLNYLRSLTPSSLPNAFAEALKDYLEIADAVEDDEAMLKEVNIYDDIEKLYEKAQTFGQSASTAKKKGSEKGKATKERATKAKAAQSSRSTATKKKAAQRAENKPKIKVGDYVRFSYQLNNGKEFGVVEKFIDDETLKIHSIDVKTGKPIKYNINVKSVLKANKSDYETFYEKYEDVPFKKGDYVKIIGLEKVVFGGKANPFNGKIGKVVHYQSDDVKVMIPNVTDGEGFLEKNVEMSTKAAYDKANKAKAEPKAKAAPKQKAEPKPKGKTKAQEQQEERLKAVKAEFKTWISKVEKEEAKLKEVIELVSPTVKAAGLGLTKTQLEIKQYEAYITILKKIYARDAKMMNSIMDKAKKALRPQDVASLQKAIIKAQDILSPAVPMGMNGIRETLKDKPKAKKKGKSKSKAKAKQEPKEEEPKQGLIGRFFAGIFN